MRCGALPNLSGLRLHARIGTGAEEALDEPSDMMWRLEARLEELRAREERGLRMVDERVARAARRAASEEASNATQAWQAARDIYKKVRLVREDRENRHILRSLSLSDKVKAQLEKAEDAARGAIIADAEWAMRNAEKMQSAPPPTFVMTDERREKWQAAERGYRSFFESINALADDVQTFLSRESTEPVDVLPRNLAIRMTDIQTALARAEMFAADASGDIDGREAWKRLLWKYKAVRNGALANRTHVKWTRVLEHAWEVRMHALWEESVDLGSRPQVEAREDEQVEAAREP